MLWSNVHGPGETEAGNLTGVPLVPKTEGKKTRWDAVCAVKYWWLPCSWKRPEFLQLRVPQAAQDGSSLVKLDLEDDIWGEKREERPKPASCLAEVSVTHTKCGGRGFRHKSLCGTTTTWK